MPGCGYVAVPRDLVGRVDDDHALACVVGEDAGHVAQHGRLAHARLAEQQDALSRSYDVLDDADGAVDRSPDANGQPDDLPGAVAYGRDAVQRPLDARPIIGPERADVLRDVFEIVVVDLAVAEDDGVIREPRLRHPSEIKDDFEKLVAVFPVYQPFRDPGRELFDDLLEVCFNPLLHGGYCSENNRPPVGAIHESPLLLGIACCVRFFPADPLPPLRQIDGRVQSTDPNGPARLWDGDRTGDRPRHGDVPSDLPVAALPHEGLQTALMIAREDVPVADSP